jgi:uncharacterized membrane protein
MQIKLSIILLVAFCALLGATGQLFFKLSSKHLTFNILSLLTNWKLFLGLFFYGIATIIFVFALKEGNLSILYPIIATSYMWVALFSKIFLKEAFPTYKWIGIIILLFSIWIITK